ncbi:MAG: sulfatase [Bacteroidota bacterium]
MLNPIISFILLFISFSCHKQVAQENEATSMTPPNIIWLVAEDLSPRFAFYGDSLAHTPHLNAIAKKGIIFENAFTVAGVCAPSRSGMITGCYPTSIGTQHMRQQKSVIPMPGFPRYNAVPPPEIKAFPELLRAAGYWTSSYRKLDYQFGTPFTIWDEVADKPHWRNRKLKDQKRPFFIYSTYEITHEINIWPDSTKARFFKEFNLDVNKLAPDVRIRPPFDSAYTVNPSEVKVPPYLPDTEVSREHIARLYNNISRMDKQIGGLMADLKVDGLLDNTIIFIMSDHGDCLPRAKRWIYDSGIKSPLVIYIPKQYLPTGFEQPSQVKELISYIDLAPTVLSFAGISIPEWMQGKPIFSTLKNKPREYIFAGRDRMDNRYDTRRAVRSKQYKYIYNYAPENPYQQQITFLEQMPLMKEVLNLNYTGKLNQTQSYWLNKNKPKEELYDILNDPFELKNLANEPSLQSVKEEMYLALKNWQTEFGDWENIPETKQAESMWPNNQQPKTEQPKVLKNNNLITITCETYGASIAYKLENNDRWEIYTGPFKSAKKLLVKAQRYGYEESDIVEVIKGS